MLAGTRDFDENVVSFKVYTFLWETIRDSRIEVVDNFNVRADGFDPG